MRPTPSLRGWCFLVLSLLVVRSSVRWKYQQSSLQKAETSTRSSEGPFLVSAIDDERQLFTTAEEPPTPPRDSDSTIHSSASVCSRSTNSRPHHTIFIPTARRGNEAEIAVESLISNDTATSSTVLNSLNCSITAQIQLHQTKAQWWLATLDANGKKKTTGGDEMYVSYASCGTKADAVAYVNDCGDGYYTLDFVATPMTDLRCNNSTNGTLRVYFQYSCGIGSMPPPAKSDWLSNGSTHMSMQVRNVNYPPTRKFEQPPSAVNLSHYKLVVGFGDSIIRTLLKQGMQSEETSTAGFHRPNVSYAINPNSALNMHTVLAMKRKLRRFHDDDLFNQTDRALILGSAVWDILDDDASTRATTTTNHKNNSMMFLDHLEACRDLVNYARRRYPGTTVIWKLPHALHPHHLSHAGCYSNEECRTRVRYMSNSRMRVLHAYQQQLMQALSVPTIDTYEAYFLGADYAEVNDGRHFVPQYNKFVLDMLYEQS